MSLVAELKRRNVFRVAAAYAVLSWLVLQIADVLFEALELPATYSKLIVALLALGFIPAVVFSWVYELTPEGLKRESDVKPEESVTAHTGNKLNVAIVVLLALAVGMFAVDRFIMHRPAAGPVPVAEKEPPAESSQAATPAAPEARESPPAETAGSGIQEASVAVLPFTTRSRNEDDEFFSDGVHDDLLTQLAKIGSLRVISRTSVMDYRNTAKRIPEIAGELGVATIVEGAVQRSGNMVRITAQLIDAGTDEHLWAESYDRELTAGNLFAIQTEIATSIATALKATLSPEEQAALRRPLTDSLEALEAYQRARFFMDSFTVESSQRAQREIEAALAQDPEFAAAWALLARVHLQYYWFREASDTYRREARAAIERARAIDADLPEVGIAEGYYYYWGFRNYDEALAVLAPVLSAYPNDAELHKLVAFINRRAGRFEDSLRHTHRALQLDPRSATVLQTLAETYTRLGRYGPGQEYTDMLLRVAPGDPLGPVCRAALIFLRDGDPGKAATLYETVADSVAWVQPATWMAYLAAGEYEKALRWVSEGLEWPSVTGMSRSFARGMALKLMGEPSARGELEKGLGELEAIAAGNPDPTLARSSLCVAHGALGDQVKAREVCARTLEAMPFDAFDRPWVETTVATGYALADLDDLAFEILGAAMASPVGPARNELTMNPFFAGLHDDPRWAALVAEARP